MHSNTTRFSRSTRTARQLDTALERELATFNSDSDRNDLEALLDTYPEAQTHDIREILARQAA